jgi:serine protease Do
MKQLALAAAVTAATLIGFAGVRVSAQDAFVFQAPGASIGVAVRDLRADDAQKSGVQVESVRADSPAARAGVKVNDVVVEYGGEAVRSVRQFTRLVQESVPSRSLKMTIVRGSARQTLEITPDPGGRLTGLDNLPQINREVERALREVPRNFDFDFDFDGAVVVNSRSRLGASLTPMSDQLSDYFGVKNGVLVSSVFAESAASRAGLKAGDVITEINGRGIDRPSDVTAAIRAAGSDGKLSVKVTRDRKELTLDLMVPERDRVRTRASRTPA